MSLDGLLTQTATVTPRTQDDAHEDEDGNAPILNGTPVDYPCRLEQLGFGGFGTGSSTELLNDQDRVTTALTLYLPPDAVVGPLDAVDVEGAHYEVMGDPAVQRGPEGPHHIVVALRLIEGG